MVDERLFSSLKLVNAILQLSEFFEFVHLALLQLVLQVLHFVVDLVLIGSDLNLCNCILVIALSNGDSGRGDVEEKSISL